MKINALKPIKLHHIKEYRDAKRCRRIEFWLYECFCGNTKIIRKNDVLTGGTRSCGCLKIEAAVKNLTAIDNITHGEARNKNKTMEYRCWERIKQRCLNQKNKVYKYYGGRGIKMYGPWIASYAEFLNYILSSIGRRPSNKYSIDRIDNDGNYTPGNLRWATQSQQNFNRRGSKL